MSSRPSRSRKAPARLLDEGPSKTQDTTKNPATTKRQAALQQSKKQARTSTVSKARGMTTSSTTKSQPTAKPKRGGRVTRTVTPRPKAKASAKKTAATQTTTTSNGTRSRRAATVPAKATKAKAAPTRSAKAKAAPTKAPKAKAAPANSDSTTRKGTKRAAPTRAVSSTPKKAKTDAAGTRSTPRKMLPADVRAAIDSATVDELKERLKANGQILAGTKAELIERVSDCVLNGCLPKCPKCFIGRLKKRATGNYFCPGGYDDDQYVRCSYKTKTEPERPAWKKDPTALF